MLAAQVESEADEVAVDGTEGGGECLIACGSERGAAGDDVVAGAVGHAEGGVVGDADRVPEDPADQPVRHQRGAA